MLFTKNDNYINPELLYWIGDDSADSTFSVTESSQLFLYTQPAVCITSASTLLYSIPEYFLFVFYVFMFVCFYVMLLPVILKLRRLGEKPVGRKRLGELFFGRQTIGRQAGTVWRQQIGRLGDIVQTVGRNVWKRRKSKLVILSYDRCVPVRD